MLIIYALHERGEIVIDDNRFDRLYNSFFSESSKENVHKKLNVKWIYWERYVLINLYEL